MSWWQKLGIGSRDWLEDTPVEALTPMIETTIGGFPAKVSNSGIRVVDADGKPDHDHYMVFLDVPLDYDWKAHVPS